jgi:purine-binding chemotaxis protein CheW
MQSLTETRQVCTFFVGHLHLGVQVERIHEVLGTMPITRVPLADPVVAGLIHLRGQVIVAIDLRRRLGLPSESRVESRMSAVIQTQKGAVAFLVDRAGDVLDVKQESFDPCPETLQASARKFITGAYALEGGLLLALDCDQTADLANESIPQAERSPHS